jgi:DNA repair protein RecO (recombination protein O)
MNLVAAVIYKKERAELHLLTQCETLAPLAGLRSDLDRMQAGMGMVELADAVLHPDDPNPIIFNLLGESLEAADHATYSPDLAFHRFEARLLDLLGFRPGLESCAVCGRPVAAESGEGRSDLALADAGVVCTSCARRNAGSVPVTREAVLLLRRLMEPGAAMEMLMGTNPDVAAAAGRAVQWLYAAHVHGYKGLKSERVFRALGATR